MERLSLDAFKAEVETKETTNELVELTGGVLGACHCTICGGDDGNNLWDLWVHTMFNCDVW